LAKPVVDGLERDLKGKSAVLRLDVLSQLGRQAGAHFGVRGVPTLMVVDGKGQVVLTQVGLLQPAEVQARVDQLLNQSNTR
jgi:thioredoxin-like negative regulator of GroEL